MRAKNSSETSLSEQKCPVKNVGSVKDRCEIALSTCALSTLSAKPWENGKKDLEHLPPHELAESILVKEKQIAELMEEIKTLLVKQ